jgi:hypothetical protein
VYNIKLTFNTTAAPAIHDQKDEYPSIIGSDSVDDVVLPSTGPNRMVGVSPPKAVEHLWGTSTACFSSRPNVIVLSDVVYDPEGYEPLISSLKNLAIDRKTQIFMAHRSRNPMEHLFFSQLECIFEIEQKNWAKELGQEDKEKTSPLSDIKIFTMRRKV